MPRIIKHKWKGNLLTLRNIYDQEKPEDVCFTTFNCRVNRDGWPIGKALFTPVNKKTKGNPRWEGLSDEPKG